MAECAGVISSVLLDFGETVVYSAYALGQLREVLKFGHYSIRTEMAYLRWIKRFILFHKKQHPLKIGVPEVERFLTYLAVDLNVAGSTQNQALNAIVFLYKKVLKVELGKMENITRAKRPQRLPTVFSKEEIMRILPHLEGVNGLANKLMYGSGLRVMERLRMRVHDLEFDRKQINVRDGKGGKDRVTVLPPSLINPLRELLKIGYTVHQNDLANGLGEVHLPHALARKYPNAAKEWGLQYVFFAHNTAKDPRSD